MSIHPTAIIDPSAELGAGVEVGPYAIIEASVRIGDNCRIGPHGVIGAGTVMGKNNTTFSGTQIGVLPQDLKHVPGAYGKTIIGDHNTFREFVTISSSTVYPGEDGTKETRIGSGCLLMANCHIGHDCHVGSGVIMANSAALSGHVTVHDRAILGGLTGVHQFCTIGRMAFIGGMARVNKDALPFMITEGHPVRCFGPNLVGLQRNGLDAEAIGRIRRIYKLLYRSGLNTRQAVAAIEADVPDSPERTTLLDFIAKSARGITK
ncbi:MAG: acyl-ACP--UDP-N-acetylglucosamine O-acyltransferase [Candidatus Hydrogenedens sp.]|nr:acyl-ACP--UDP-N-acetylglucosamine O-acyltransferase [Candidatus Hydrogenedens sp.]